MSLVPSWKKKKKKNKAKQKNMRVNQHAAMKSGAIDFIVFSCKIA